jgi:bla regulator protein blaR1
MTLLAWMIYAVLVAILLGGAGWVLERALLALGRPVRWVWVLALAGGAGIPLVTLTGLATGDPDPQGVALLHGPEGANALPRHTASPSTLAPLFRVSGKLSETLTDGIRRLANVVPAAHLAHRTLALMWGGGSLLLFLTLAGSTLRLGRRLRRWPSVQLRGRDRVRVTPGLGPAVIGLLRPWIVLPRWVLHLEPGRLEQVLVHEEEHVSARDTLVLASAAASVLASFWNPALWWILGRLRSSVEMDCDRRVLSRGIAPREYGSLLVEVGSRGDRLPLHMAALSEPSNLLERRLREMRPKSLRHPILAFAGASVLATVLILVACDTQVPAPTAATDEEVAALPADEASAEPLAPGLEPTVMGDATPAGETVGETVRVRTRTDQTLRAGAEAAPSPLYIVDGVIVGANALERLNIKASQIESIEVVKGAAAAALYGSRAENGVIMITTKDAPGGGGA